MKLWPNDNQRQDFCDHDAIQHEYLDKLGMRYPQDEDPYLQEWYRQRQEKQKLEKICKLQREWKFLERNVQRVKTKLQKLQHCLTLTPSTNTADLWPKLLISQHDYHTVTQSKVHDTHEHDT